MRAAAIIPAYEAVATVGSVVAELRALWPWPECSIIVVDDGSVDGTAEAAERAGAIVLRHRRNRGKGAALRTALGHAQALGARLAVSLDADAQHPPAEAVRMLLDPAPEHALVLGVRDLVAAGAPGASRFSNGFSNFFLELFSGRCLADTQCGLRRYPVAATLALGVRADGYAFEAEVILRAARAGWAIVQLPVRVVYPPAHERITHFHPVRDPTRIVLRVLHTVATAPGPR